MYVCICFGVTESDLGGVLAAGARSEEEVGDACGAGTGCGSCLDRICDRISLVHSGPGTQIASAA